MTPPRKDTMHVVATAGHVDHGKSALVRELTGMEPDRWEEERRRGLTLDLGFVWRRFPGGPALVFVDVPGHERLMGNMLAGTGPAPAVLFVVAADQGWQTQSEEHLSVLHALGIRHGVLAVTRSDLADPEPVRADALARIAATSLGDVESVAVSAVTGRGLGALQAALLRMTGALPAPDPDADVRLWTDRVFTVRGRGTVITGTLSAGTLRTGDRLVLDGRDEPLRIRGLQTLKEDREEVAAVARVAVDVHGPATTRLRRGDALLTPGRWLTTSTADVRLHGDPPERVPRELALHIGSTSVPAVVRPLGHDTARLRWQRPLPLRIGDTALLRDSGAHRIAAGVTVLDVRPRPLRRRGDAAARARELAAATGTADAAAELRRRGLVRRTDLAAMGVTDLPGPVAGDWLADPAHWAAFRSRLAETVEEHAARNPADPGLSLEAARRALDLPDRALVEALAAGGGLHRRNGRLYGTAARPRLPEPVRAAVDAVCRDLHAAPFRAPDADRLAALGLTPALQAAAAASGDLLRVADGVLLLPGADGRAAGVLAALQQPFTLSEARRALGTTRRVAVPLLEYLDARGHTVRVDKDRRRCRHAPGTAVSGG